LPYWGCSKTGSTRDCTERSSHHVRRGREDWHRSRNQCTVSDSIYEHLQGRVDEVICRTTCRLLRTNRPTRNLAVDLWPAPISPAFMPARIASRSFVVASLVRTQPEHRAQDKRCWPFASPQQDRRWPFASRVNVEPGRTTHAQEQCTCSTSPHPRCARRFCSCSEPKPYQDQQRNARSSAVRRPPGDTQEQDLFLADRPGVTCSSFSKWLGSATAGCCAGHPTSHRHRSLAWTRCTRADDAPPGSLSIPCWQCRVRCMRPAARRGAASVYE
jgi:hypothetical protein